MSIHDDVYEQLKQNGPMGVNALSKALNIPLSTMQKYLDKDQSYFKKNISRKWELPEESIRSDMSLVSNNIGNVIDSQLMSMQALIDTLMSQFRATVTLIKTNKPSNAAVAVKSPKLDDNIERVVKFINAFNEALKKHKSQIDEDYRDLFINLDISRLVTERGLNFFFDTQYKDLTAVLMNGSNELSNETLKIIEEYQKEA